MTSYLFSFQSNFSSKLRKTFSFLLGDLDLKKMLLEDFGNTILISNSYGPYGRDIQSKGIKHPS